MPAWINKYYILDLQEKNSLVKWLVDQGYTVFMISWVNPNETHVEKSFDDYLLEGPLAAIGAIEKATGEKQVAMMGYCLGGTMTAITQAWLKAKGKGNRIVSATYLTTMIDYGDAGDLSVFIDEEQLSDLEKQMQGKGYLDAGVMANTFSLLRANDLIWSFVVNNYLLGREPFPFDILYWNSDSTRMPAKMQSYYLRNMYQHNRLKDSGALTIGGVKIDLATIEAPAYLLSTQEDHIAPWQSIYEATDIFSGDVTFVLAGSGHVSGVVNAPAKNRYGYHINPELTEGANAWLTSAHYHEGSWWGHWHRWQQPLMGKKVKAHKPAQSIEAAPGSYVKVRT
jgi:polyhydroxyalkanoate synthase